VNREEIHRCWAPADGRWSAWVKPVLFANLDEDSEPRLLTPTPEWLRGAAIEPLLSASRASATAEAHPYRGQPPLSDTALVIDLPGELSVRVGAALIEWGVRPIPLFNAVPAFLAVVDLRPLMAMLVDAAERVARAPRSGPPAFLLDANRESGSRLVRPGVFDNRSVCRESDFPSAETLWQAGIRRALLIQSAGDRPATDLEPVLAAWQRRGVQLWKMSSGGNAPSAPFLLERRWWGRRMIHAIRRSFLRLRPDDAYGMTVPEPSAG
jgi:hypothetical protein